MYTSINFPTKKSLREYVAAGGKVHCFQPAGIGSVPDNGEVSVEGPHYPQPHRWYARVTLKDGYITSVK